MTLSLLNDSDTGKEPRLRFFEGEWTFDGKPLTPEQQALCATAIQLWGGTAVHVKVTITDRKAGK